MHYPKEITKLKDPEFNEDALLVTAMDLFGAGSETTATTLSWALLYMILYPEIQKKVHDEIDEILAGKEPSLDDRIQWVMLKSIKIKKKQSKKRTLYRYGKIF